MIIFNFFSNTIKSVLTNAVLMLVMTWVLFFFAKLYYF